MVITENIAFDAIFPRNFPARQGKTRVHWSLLGQQRGVDATGGAAA
jgi:hypothetical protein